MKLVQTLLGYLLIASISAQVPTMAVADVGNCIDNIEKSVAVIKAIQTDLYHMAKYWDLIKQFVQLKDFLKNGHTSCVKATPDDVKKWLAAHQPSDVAQCALDVYLLVVDVRLLQMDLDEKKYTTAVRDLKDLVVQANNVKNDCSKVVFVAWK